MFKNCSEIVEKLKQRLQFIIVVILFFPTFLETIFITQDNLELQQNTLGWMIIISLFFILYLIIEYKDRKLNEGTIKDLNILFLVYVGFFIPIFLSNIFEKQVGTLLGDIFIVGLKVSMWSILILPFVFIVLSIINYKKPIKEYLKFLRKKIKKQ